MSVQNVFPAASIVVVVYRHRDTGQTWSDSFQLPAFSSKIVATLNNPNLPDGWVGSAWIDSDIGKPINVIINEVRQ